MVKQRPSGFRTYTSYFAVAVAAAAMLGVGGCSASATSGGTASPDGGDDASPTGGCTPSDCAGLAAPAIGMVCPDGSSVGATLCTRQSSGKCDWGFPACPTEGGACPALGCDPACPNGVLKDANGCDTCQCAPASDAGGTGTCTTDTDCPNGKICGFLEADGCAATGQCFPAPGARCALASAIGCGCHGNAVPVDPSCVSGLPSGYQPQPVLHEGACSDGGASDGGACVSQQGGPCGGNRANPCTCATGLTCTPGDGGAPFGDVGGTCR